MIWEKIMRKLTKHWHLIYSDNIQHNVGGSVCFGVLLKETLNATETLLVAFWEQYVRYGFT